MHIQFASDIAREHISAQGVELATIMGRDTKDGKRVFMYADDVLEHVHTFDNPVLVTDNYRIGQLAPTLRETLFALFQRNQRTFVYDDVSISFDAAKYPGVWSPSIDTVLLAESVSNVLSTTEPLRVAEIGCGSGYLSKYALAKGKSIKELVVNDINPLALLCAQYNIPDSRATFVQGDGLKLFTGEQFDMIICNPPYVPRPRSIDDNPYEGVSVAHYLLHEGRKHLRKGGCLVINISSLCEDIVLDKDAMQTEELRRLEVPLKVNNILNNPVWMNYLTNERGMKSDYHDGYEYWQTLRILEARV